MMIQNNPLLKLSALPNMAPPFDRIQEDHFLPAIEESIRIARTNIDAI
jgi:peptidyl-dipeptidase Dcp